MPKIIKTEVEETLYRYEELEDDAKQKVVDDHLDDVWFSRYVNDKLNAAQVELIEMGEALLKESIFRHATANDVYYDFSYSQGSGAVLEFDYGDKNFALDFPKIKEDIIEEFISNKKWRDSYNLEEEEAQELLNVLKSKELNALFDIDFIVEHTGRYANFIIDYKVNCWANDNIRYCLEELVDDWIYQNLMKNSSFVDDVESEFSSRAYSWYDNMCNIENYSNDDFEGYYYDDGRFAGYEDDF